MLIAAWIPSEYQKPLRKKKNMADLQNQARETASICSYFNFHELSSSDIPPMMLLLYCIWIWLSKKKNVKNTKEWNIFWSVIEQFQSRQWEKAAIM